MKKDIKFVYSQIHAHTYDEIVDGIRWIVNFLLDCSIQILDVIEIVRKKYFFACL